MGKTGHSEPRIFGGYTHYDAKGRKVGSSDPRIFGGYTHYDAKGHKVGSSDPRAFGGYTHYDSKGHRVGSSQPGFFNGYTNYDAKGHKIGRSDPELFGGYSHSKGDACYVATAVYGTYDCPEVWTLRRFRDQYLKASRLGRLFIKVYYSTSPALVRRFGGCGLVCRWCRDLLDSLVGCLQRRGYESSPYADRKNASPASTAPPESLPVSPPVVR